MGCRLCCQLRLCLQMCRIDSALIPPRAIFDFLSWLEPLAALVGKSDGHRLLLSFFILFFLPIAFESFGLSPLRMSVLSRLRNVQSPEQGTFFWFSGIYFFRPRKKPTKQHLLDVHGLPSFLPSFLSLLHSFISKSKLCCAVRRAHKFLPVDLLSKKKWLLRFPTCSFCTVTDTIPCIVRSHLSLLSKYQLCTLP